MAERSTHHEHDTSRPDSHLSALPHHDGSLVGVAVPNLPPDHSERAALHTHVIELLREQQRLEAELDVAVTALADALEQRNGFRSLLALKVHECAALAREVRRLQRQEVP